MAYQVAWARDIRVGSGALGASNQRNGDEGRHEQDFEFHSSPPSHAAFVGSLGRSRVIVTALVAGDAEFGQLAILN